MSGPPNVLPDSRPRHTRGAVFFQGPAAPGMLGGWWAPVYCINCGRRWGMVPEKMITHVVALCDKGCAVKYGDDAHFWVDSDAVFRDRAVQAQLEDYGRLLSPAELRRALELGPSRGLAATARDWHARVSKVA